MQRLRQDSDYKALALCSRRCTVSLEGKKHYAPQPNELTTECVQVLQCGNGEKTTTIESRLA